MVVGTDDVQPVNFWAVREVISAQLAYYKVINANCWVICISFAADRAACLFAAQWSVVLQSEASNLRLTFLSRSVQGTKVFGGLPSAERRCRGEGSTSRGGAAAGGCE